MDALVAREAPVEEVINKFLALPAEIRNVLYRLLLTSPLIESLRSLRAVNRCSDYVLPVIPLYPNLLATCKQIHAEATPILYGENTFTAHGSLLTNMPHLCSPARPLRTVGISSRIGRWYVLVRLDIDSRFTSEQAEKAFTGAEFLQVEASQTMFRSADMRNLLLFGGVRGVKQAKVGGSVDRPFAKWLEDAMMSPVGAEVEEFEDNQEELVWVKGGYDVWHHGGR